jgi:hypothetical protein
MFAVDTDIAKVEREPPKPPASPRLLMFWTVNVLILPNSEFVLNVDRLEMYAVEAFSTAAEMLPGNPKTPVALIFCAVNELMFAVCDVVLNVDKLEIYIVEKLPPTPIILLVVIDDATNDEVKSCWKVLPSL